MHLERSTLVYPATDWKLLENALSSPADRVLIDLDDLVATQNKTGARKNAAKALVDLDWENRPRAFRINAWNTPYAYSDLSEILSEAGKSVDLLVVPKIDRPEEVVWVDSLLTQLENTLGLQHSIQLEIQIESAEALLKVGEIARASRRTEALIFGRGDFAASMGFPLATYPMSAAEQNRLQWQYPLYQIAVAASAAQMRTIDGPYADIDDLIGFRASCEESNCLGYQGKWCLNLEQVQIANQVFCPSNEQIQYAIEILTTYEQATANGDTLVFLQGKLIDAAVLRSANFTLNRARLITGADRQT